MADQRRDASHAVSHDLNLEDDNIRETDQPNEPGPVRDPKYLNTHLKLMYDDIFAEPHPSVHSYDSVWSTSDQVFQVTRTTCYRITSLLCAVPAAVCWGLYFAFLTCCSIWCCRPYIRAFEIKMQCMRDCLSPLVDACIRPCTEALGACFSNLRLTVLQRKAEQPGFTI